MFAHSYLLYRKTVSSFLGTELKLTRKKKKKIISILIEVRTFRTQKLLINTISNLKHNALTAMKYLQIIPLADHLNLTKSTQ